VNALQQAEKNLKDYFDSLEPEDKAKALAFQRALEDEASKTEGGMSAVIEKRCNHNRMLLEETMHEVLDIATMEAAKLSLQKFTL
jgi:hypothetical protein